MGYPSDLNDKQWDIMRWPNLSRLKIKNYEIQIGPPHTDQGSQFTSKNFISVLEKHEIKISMDGKGRALDNVFIERFWRSLKQEKIYMIILNTVKEAKNAIINYMDFYNKKRMHQALEYLTPAQVYFKKNVV